MPEYIRQIKQITSITDHRRGKGVSENMRAYHPFHPCSGGNPIHTRFDSVGAPSIPSLGPKKRISRLPSFLMILFHEYAHVVVFDLTRGNCPVWLNEGIAEMFGRKQFTYPASERVQEAMKAAVIDVHRLEGSFTGLSSHEANRAYQQSYSMVSYLVTAYGWHRVNAILTALGKGMNITAAIASALQDYSLSYDGLVKEWRESLQR